MPRRPRRDASVKFMHVLVCDSETEAGSSSIDDDYNILGSSAAAAAPAAGQTGIVATAVHLWHIISKFQRLQRERDLDSS